MVNTGMFKAFNTKTNESLDNQRNVETSNTSFET